MIDKNLFPYNLAIVTTMKNEEPYVKEWLDYHLLAGVDHFYIYDNESTPEFKKILQPYIDADVVTYTYFPGKAQQLAAYQDAIMRFKFDCRYIAFIDCDEFIYTKKSSSLREFINFASDRTPDAGGFYMHWMFYGSNRQEKADYSRGVLERFTRRAVEVEKDVKCIVNPRKVNYFWTPHFPVYLDEVRFVDFDEDIIRLNHYYTKSVEEFEIRSKRGDGIYNNDNPVRSLLLFDERDKNNEFDDSALRYRDNLKAELIPQGNGIEYLFDNLQPDWKRIFAAVNNNLTPTFDPQTPDEFFEGKTETFLTCWHLAVESGKKGIIGEDNVNFLVEASFNALKKVLMTKYSFTDLNMIVKNLPELLTPPSPIVKDFRQLLINVISTWQDEMRLQIKQEQQLGVFAEISELNYIQRMLEVFDAYEKK